LNAYFYRSTEVEGKSISYFKHAVFALRFWFRILGMEDAAIKLPSIKKKPNLTSSIIKARVQTIV
ncbi:MAG: hypothetical protein AN481_19995, partial [Aphanizomenon flos-aquae LD13]